MKRWAREPLLHFLLLGALLFVVDGLFVGPARPAGGIIVISDAQVDSLIDLFQLQWGRPPTQQELSGLVDGYVREEVMYREALAMGLDRDDTIVRRRMMQKLEFLSQDMVDPNPPDADLRAFFEAEQERFLLPAEISFAHVYLNPDRHGADLDRDAATLLERLRASPELPIDDLGDRIMLDARYASETPQGVAARFGSEFAGAVFELAPGVWSGPVVSGYGLHLVRVDSRIDPRPPGFEAVRDRVLAEYLSRARLQADERMYESMRSRYEVVFDFAAAGEGAAQ